MPPEAQKIAYRTPEQVKVYVAQKAVEAGVSPTLAVHIASREGMLIATSTGDLHITCPRTGEPVYARGLPQITRCYHPEVTDEQAFDIEFAVEWMMPRLKDKKTCLREWTQCRIYYGVEK